MKGSDLDRLGVRSDGERVESDGEGVEFEGEGVESDGERVEFDGLGLVTDDVIAVVASLEQFKARIAQLLSAKIEDETMNDTSLPPAQVVEEFRQRRKRQWLAAIPGVAAGMIVVLALERDSVPLFALNSTALTLGAGVVVIAYLMFSIWNWRCPACDKYLGKGMNPSFCTKCGVKLKA